MHVNTVTYKVVGNKELTLDIYSPEVKRYEKSPALILIHGGGWMWGTKQEEFDFFNREGLCNNLLAEGYSVISVEYRLAVDGVVFPTPVADCMDAISWIIDNADEFNLDATNIGLGGSSAGGYLVLLSGMAAHSNVFSQECVYETPKCNVRYMIDFCGPTYLHPNANQTYNERIVGFVENFLGTNIEGNNPIFDVSSPVSYINKNNPPLLMIHGNKDALVPFSQSQLFYDVAVANGCDVEFIVAHNTDHYMGSPDEQPMQPSAEELFDKCYSFVKAHYIKIT